MKPRIFAIAALLATIGGASAPVVADQTAAPVAQKTLSGAPDDKAKQSVTITGERAELQRRIAIFVNQLTAFDPADPIQGLARWQEPVCPTVSGLAGNEGEFILGRISEVARDVGVRLAGEKCRPNLYVLVSAQTRPLLQAMEKRNRYFTFGQAARPLIDTFIAAPLPVKVWYHTVERTPGGQPLVCEQVSLPDYQSTQLELQNQPSQLVEAPNVVIGGTGNCTPTNGWSEASHLMLNAVGALYRVFVYVDQTQLHGANLGQIADYTAMVGLAQIKPGARLGEAPTILTLFSKGPQTALPGMSDWDRDFLKALYATDPQTKMQRNDIALDMVRAVVPR